MKLHVMLHRRHCTINADINSDDHDAAAYGRVLQNRMDTRERSDAASTEGVPLWDAAVESQQLASELERLQMDVSIISVHSLPMCLDLTVPFITNNLSPRI